MGASDKREEDKTDAVGSEYQEIQGILSQHVGESVVVKQVYHADDESIARCLELSSICYGANAGCLCPIIPLLPCVAILLSMNCMICSITSNLSFQKKIANEAKGCMYVITDKGVATISNDNKVLHYTPFEKKVVVTIDVTTYRAEVSGTCGDFSHHQPVLKFVTPRGGIMDYKEKSVMKMGLQKEMTEGFSHQVWFIKDAKASLGQISSSIPPVQGVGMMGALAGMMAQFGGGVNSALDTMVANTSFANNAYVQQMNFPGASVPEAVPAEPVVAPVLQEMTKVASSRNEIRIKVAIESCPGDVRFFKFQSDWSMDQLKTSILEEFERKSPTGNCKLFVESSGDLLELDDVNDLEKDDKVIVKI